MAVNTDKDFYKILGVSKDADQATIKKAYRKLAKDLHPDKHQGDKQVEERFKEISEAYDVLSDSTRREEYDQMRAYVASGGVRGGGMPGGNFGDMFGQGGVTFGDLGDIFGGLFGGGRSRGPRRGADLETSVTLSFEDALRGATVPLRLNVENPCATCRGSGVVKNAACSSCQGAGRTYSMQTIQARIPAGVKPDQKIRLKGKGGAGDAGAPAGDLFIRVGITPHAIFSREENNLTVTVPIRFDEAVLGADIKVPVFDGAPVTIRIPAGTKTGAKFRARGKGVVQSDGRAGDLIVTVDLAVPKNLNAKAQEALIALREELADFDPRADLMKNAQTNQAGN